MPILIIINLFFMVLEFEPRALQMPGKRSAAEL